MMGTMGNGCAGVVESANARQRGGILLSYNGVLNHSKIPGEMMNSCLAGCHFRIL